jgi:hypothetical protein
VSENYHVKEDKMTEILSHFGVQPQLDAFATEKNKRFPQWWGSGSPDGTDAFEKDWHGKLLWMNPPFSKISQVVRKIQTDEAHALLMVPRWVHRRWYMEIKRVAVMSMFIPAKTKLFGQGDKKCRETPWPVEVFLVCGHKTRCKYLPGFHKHFTPLHPTSKVRFGTAHEYPPVEDEVEGGEQKPDLGTEKPQKHIRKLQEAATATPERATAEKPKPKMLDLFCGTKSVSKVYEKMGFDVVTVDSDPRWKADYQVDVLDWDFRKHFKPGEFHTVVCGVPCTEFSIALTTRPRNLEKGDSLAKKALEIVEFLQPQKWWLENPRYGYLGKRDYMKPYPYIDVDYCQYTDWGYKKPTRIWGSPDILQVPAKRCDGKTCKNLDPNGGGHLVKLSNKHNIPAFKKFRIPEQLIQDLAGFHERLRQTSQAQAAQQQPLQQPSPAQTARQNMLSQPSPELTGQQPNPDSTDKTEPDQNIRLPKRLCEPVSKLLLGQVISRKKAKQLLIEVRAVLPDGKKMFLQALIDTGAQANLVKKNLIPQQNSDFHKNPWP